MKKILVINPNSSKEMKQSIQKTIEESEGFYESKDFQIEVVGLEGAPHVLDSFTDYTVAGGEALKYIISHDMSQYAGILLACFGDPCLFAIKEAVPIPVIGIAEAALSRALLLGSRFSIIAANDKAISMMESLVDSYGLQDRNAGTKGIHTNIEDFLDKPEQLKANLLKVVHEAEAAGAEAVIYGCAGMTMIPKKELEEATQMALIDPIVSGISTLEAVIKDGDRISRSGLYKG